MKSDTIQIEPGKNPILKTGTSLSDPNPWFISLIRQFRQFGERGGHAANMRHRRPAHEGVRADATRALMRQGPTSKTKRGVVSALNQPRTP